MAKIRLPRRRKKKQSVIKSWFQRLPTAVRVKLMAICGGLCGLLLITLAMCAGAAETTDEYADNNTATDEGFALIWGEASGEEDRIGISDINNSGTQYFIRVFTLVAKCPLEVSEITVCVGELSAPLKMTVYGKKESEKKSLCIADAGAGAVSIEAAFSWEMETEDYLVFVFEREIPLECIFATYTKKDIEETT